MGTTRREGFTLIELLAVIAVIAVLVAILLPCLRKAKEYARRSVCMGHLRQMQIAWQTYADEHDGRIVNGQAGPTTAPYANAGRPWLTNSGLYAQNAESAAKSMRTGALASYVGDIRVYLCPSRYRHIKGDPTSEWLSSYMIVPSMNCYPPEQWRPAMPQLRFLCDVGRTVLFVSKTSDLVDPGPSSRMVFYDLGMRSMWIFGGSPLGIWNNLLDGEGGLFPLHHENGTCMSFADGHTEYWRWRDPNTLFAARDEEDELVRGVPSAPDDVALRKTNPDVVRLHRAIWGKGP
jgi:prepilin-type N-terminal cleavage/methylation domain-containing protein